LTRAIEILNCNPFGWLQYRRGDRSRPGHGHRLIEWKSVKKNQLGGPGGDQGLGSGPWAIRPVDLVELDRGPGGPCLVDLHVALQNQFDGKAPLHPGATFFGSLRAFWTLSYKCFLMASVLISFFFKFCTPDYVDYLNPIFFLVFLSGVLLSTSNTDGSRRS
jgi:hypothetical protein